MSHIGACAEIPWEQYCHTPSWKVTCLQSNTDHLGFPLYYSIDLCFHTWNGLNHTFKVNSCCKASYLCHRYFLIMVSLHIKTICKGRFISKVLLVSNLSTRFHNSWIQKRWVPAFIFSYILQEFRAKVDARSKRKIVF